MTTEGPRKVVTHAGVFHGDDVVAVAIAMCAYGAIALERTFTPAPQDLANPEVIILDVGIEFNPEMGNFDHHSDAMLNCAASEFFFYLKKKGLLVGNPVKAIESLLPGINAQDLGESNNMLGHMSLSHVISTFNPLVGVDSDDAFADAVDFVLSLLLRITESLDQGDAFKASALEAITAPVNACAHASTFNPILKEMCIDTDLLFVSYPGERGGFMLMCVPPSKGSFEQKLPLCRERAMLCGATFVHTGLFCASFPTLEELRNYVAHVVK